jgi:RNA polymerase sigma-70 factor (ECF subfamily)
VKPSPQVSSPTSSAPGSETTLSAHPDDVALVRDVLAGDSDARSALVDRLSLVRRVLNFRNARLGHPVGADDLEDLIQDTLFVIWRKLSVYEGRGSLDAFAYRVAVLELTARLRKLRRLPASLDAERLTLEDTEAARLADRELVERCLERLGPPDADVLRLKHMEGLTFEEVAAATESPVNTVKSRHYRGLRKLRELLGLQTAEEGAA